MRRLFRALWNFVRGAFWLVVHLLEYALTAVIAAVTGLTHTAAAVYYNRAVRVVAAIYATLVLVVPLVSFLTGATLLVLGTMHGNDWEIFAGGIVLIAGTIGTYVLLVPALFLAGALIAILQGLVGGLRHLYSEYVLRPWQRFWIPRPVVVAPAAAPAPAPAPTTRPARP